MGHTRTSDPGSDDYPPHMTAERGSPVPGTHDIGGACLIAGSEPPRPPARDRHRRGGVRYLALAQGSVRRRRRSDPGCHAQRHRLGRSGQPPQRPTSPPRRCDVSGSDRDQRRPLHGCRSGWHRRLRFTGRCGGLRHMGSRNWGAIRRALGWAFLRRILHLRRTGHRRQRDACGQRRSSHGHGDGRRRRQ